MNNSGQIKIVLMGDGRVGKTSIISKYFTNKFDDKEEMTINSCFSQKNFSYKDKTFKFCIWVNT